MKKLSLFLKCLVMLLVIGSLSVQSQNLIPNGSFENWNNQGGYEAPDGWTSSSKLTTTFGIPENAVKVSGPNDVYSGNHAIRLESTTFFGAPVSGHVGLGDITYNNETYGGGIAVTQSPDNFTGWYKFDPVNGDSAVFAIMVTKWNSTLSKRDTLGTAFFVSTNHDSIYTKFDVPFVYTSSLTPDSLFLEIISGGPSTQGGSVLYVDELAANVDTLCNNLSVWVNQGFNPAAGDMTADVTGGTPPYTYLWSNLETIQSINVLGSPGTYTVTVTDTNGCTTVGNATYDPCSNVYADFTYNIIDTTNGLFEVKFTDLSSGGGPAFYWDFGDGNTLYAQNPTHTFTTPGCYVVTVFADSAACTAKQTHQVCVGNTTPNCNNLVADFDYKDFIFGSLSVQFNDLSMSLSGNVTTWFWDFGDGTTSTNQNPLHFYNNNGCYSVMLTIGDNLQCWDTIIQQICVYDSTNNCNNLSVQVYDSVYPNGVYADLYSSVSGGTAPYSYEWSNGDQTSWTTAYNGGFYSLTVTDNNGCVTSDNIYLDTTNNANCDVFFTYQQDSVNVNGTDVYFSSDPNGKAPLTYNWYFSDGGTSTLANPKHTYSSGFFLWNWAELEVTDANGCVSYYTQYVDVDMYTSSCDAYFWAEFEDAGGSPGEVFFYDDSYGNIVAWEWDFGNGQTSTLQNPVVTYTTAGYYTICLTTTDANGCVANFCQTCYIDPSWWTNNPFNPNIGSCDADFIAFQDTATSGLVYIINLSFGGDYYTWNFYNSDTSIIINDVLPFVTFSEFGTYDVCLTVTNTNTGCQDTYCDTLTINPNGVLVNKQGNWGLSVIPTPRPASRATSTVDAEVSTADISLYPNPTNGNMSITIEGIIAEETAEIEMIDITGKTVYNAMVNLKAGNNLHQLAMDDLASGIYFVNVTATQVYHFEKVVKQ